MQFEVLVLDDLCPFGIFGFDVRRKVLMPTRHDVKALRGELLLDIARLCSGQDRFFKSMLNQIRPTGARPSQKLSDYLRVLCMSIRQQTEGVEIDVEADDLELAIDRAVPLGLILNEVATNSIKHAFGEDGGRISVRLIAGVGYGEGRLTVADNGRGYETPHQGGSGLKLTQSLARQIGGSLVQESSDMGTKTSLTFPIIT